MNQTREHYNKLLSQVYGWMSGDTEKEIDQVIQLLQQHKIHGGKGKTALDIGAGNGVQSEALVRAGYKVVAVDFCKPLLKEAALRWKSSDIQFIDDELLSFLARCKTRPYLILCWGDTLTHLKDDSELHLFIERCSHLLEHNGYLLLGFRDYTQEATGTTKIIPVKSDKDRILTCILEYYPKTVRVHDVLYERIVGSWELRSSNYQKVIIRPSDLAEHLTGKGFVVKLSVIDGVVTILAKRK